MVRSLIAVLLVTFSLSANALSILLTGGNSEREVSERLIGLGHTVEKSNAVWWGSDWDFSSYDVVAFQYGANNPTDIGNLVTAVQAGDVGVVFFRAWGANAAAEALGITTNNDNLDWQYALNNFDIVDNNHYITQGKDLGIYDLGYTYMSEVTTPGADTKTLATGPDGAALLVHNSLRVAVTPFYGHVSNFENETPLGMDITERTLQWASGATVVPVPAAAWLFGSALMGLGWLRRRPGA